jgi:hypothetical protein
MPGYILQMLSTLSVNQVPKVLRELILGESYVAYYQATIVMRSDKYYLESRDQQQLYRFADFALNPTLMVRTVQTKNGAETFYFFEIQEEKREQLKRSGEIQKCNIIEEFDYLNVCFSRFFRSVGRTQQRRESTSR